VKEKKNCINAEDCCINPMNTY